MQAFQPFGQIPCHSLFDHQIAAIKKEIDELENQYILNASITELEAFYTDKLRINPLVVDYEAKYVEGEPQSIRLDVSNNFFNARRGLSHIPGTQIIVAIPYQGDEMLWKVRPSRYSVSGYPDIYAYLNRICFAIQFPDSEAQTANVQRVLTMWLSSLESATEALLSDVNQFNNANLGNVKPWLHSKKEKAMAASGVVASLGLPIKRANQPNTYIIPVQRKQIVISKPMASREQYKPEPALNMDTYKDILNILSSMSLVIERSPHSFHKLDEEAIRTHFLMFLNGQFTGAATGETFNNSGKTDILIRIEEKNVFIGECKFWTGPSGFESTINQLLSYLTWRDCKCAILVFNRSKDSSSVLEKMHEVITKRKEFRRAVTALTDKGNTYIFVKENEPGKEIYISTMVFDFPEKLVSPESEESTKEKDKKVRAIKSKSSKL